MGCFDEGVVLVFVGGFVFLLLQSVIWGLLCRIAILS